MQPGPATGAPQQTAPAKKTRGRPRNSERGSAEAGAKDQMGVGSKGPGGGDKGEGASARSGRASGGGGFCSGGGESSRIDRGAKAAQGAKAAHRGGGGGGAKQRADAGGGGGNPAPRPYGAGKGQSNFFYFVLFSLYSIEFLFVAN